MRQRIKGECQIRHSMSLCDCRCGQSNINSDRQTLSVYSVLFDGEPDNAAPLGPRTVIYLHVVEPQQKAHREPGEGRPMAEPAVHHDFLLRIPSQAHAGSWASSDEVCPCPLWACLLGCASAHLLSLRCLILTVVISSAPPATKLFRVSPSSC